MPVLRQIHLKLISHYFNYKTDISSTGILNTRLKLIKQFEHNVNKKIERHVVLVSPEIHWNTGNIGRTCLGAGAALHLIKPIGFSLDSRQVKRAGLDYWDKIALRVWDDFNSFQKQMAPQNEEVVVFTKKGKEPFWSMLASKRMFLVFGSETKGLPDIILSIYRNNTFYIPICSAIRSLNLSTAAGIALYESLRTFSQKHFWTHANP